MKYSKMSEFNSEFSTRLNSLILIRIEKSDYKSNNFLLFTLKDFSFRLLLFFSEIEEKKICLEIFDLFDDEKLCLTNKSVI